MSLSAEETSDASVASVSSKISLVSDFRVYLGMMKPTVSMLIVVTVIPTLVQASPGSWPSPIVALSALLGTFLASGSASIFNHLIEIDSDAQMNRTRARPLPTGRLSIAKALTVAITLAVLSLSILYFGATPLAAVVALLANAFYVLGYTMFLKRRTTQNIVIGGAAGAVGPLIGWAAVSGDLAWPAWILFFLIFMWTPAHFWALAIKYKDDYAAAGIPMLPVVRGDAVTRWWIMMYAISLIPIILAMNVAFDVSTAFAVLSTLGTLGFVGMAMRLFWQRTNDLAMPVFHYSCFYLFVVFGGLTVDKLWHLI